MPVPGSARRRPKRPSRPIRSSSLAVPRPAAEVGDADDLELEPLGAVDRHQPHRVERLALDRRLALARGRRSRPTPPRGRGRARGSRAGPGPTPPRTRARGASACARWRAAAGRRASPASPGRSRCARAPARSAPRSPAGRHERARPRTTPRTPPGARDRRRRASSSAPSGSRSTHHGSRPRARAAAPSTTSASAETPDQRRGEHRVQRLLVARVGERAQVGDEVDDLRMGPVAAAADHVRRDPALLERALVDPQVGRGAGQQDDLPRRGPGADQLAAPARPAPAPRRSATATPAPRRLSRRPCRRQQLDPRLAGGRRPSRPARQRHEPLAEHAGERGVDDLEDLPPRAEVRLQRRARAGALALPPRAPRTARRRRAGSRRSTAGRRRP